MVPISMVDLPTSCTTSVIVPASGSESAMVSGIRSECSHEDDDELAGPVLARDLRRLDDIALESRCDFFDGYDLSHWTPPKKTAVRPADLIAIILHPHGRLFNLQHLACVSKSDNYATLSH